jgi:hypothetical protein
MQISFDELLPTRARFSEACSCCKHYPIGSGNSNSRRAPYNHFGNSLSHLRYTGSNPVGFFLREAALIEQLHTCLSPNHRANLIVFSVQQSICVPKLKALREDSALNNLPFY